MTVIADSYPIIFNAWGAAGAILNNLDPIYDKKIQAHAITRDNIKTFSVMLARIKASNILIVFSFWALSCARTRSKRISSSNIVG